MIRLEKRKEPSQFWRIANPFLAVALTMLAGGVMFAALGKDPVVAIRLIFFDPIFSETFGSYSRPQLLIKTAPLILIAVGLAILLR
jgi:simple sugar transport system permease protein